MSVCATLYLRLYLRFSWSFLLLKLLAARISCGGSHSLVWYHPLGQGVPLDSTLSNPLLFYSGDRVFSLTCGRTTPLFCFLLITDLCKVSESLCFCCIGLKDLPSGHNEKHGLARDFCSHAIWSENFFHCNLL